ncbi:MAG: oligosaccharide flippase family protein [Bacteroidales bacterium]|jgi:O-antigen/teichoic acid export membrane protein|nr:oligosaccharide flippase family protein [Bacteroidales bacterium]
MWKKYIKSDFARHFITLFTGSVIAQAIPLAISPILSRMYSPSDFGVWAVFISITSVIGVVATMRYEMAIVLPAEDKDARALVGLCLLATVMVSLISLLGVIILHPFILRYMGDEKLGPFLYLVPLMVFSMGVFQTFNYWSTRRKTFRMNASGRVGQSVVMASVNLGMGAMNAGGSGLVAGSIAGQFISALILGWNFLRHPVRFFSSISKEQMKVNARKYKAFAFVNSPHALFDTFQNSAVVFMLQAFFSSFILGLYSFAFRVLKSPASLIGSSVSQVFYERASRMNSEGINLKPLVWQLQQKLILVTLLPFLVLFLFTPDIFAFIFSEAYRASGEVARILIPLIFLNLMLSPFSSLPVILNRQKEAFVITIADFILKVGSVSAGGITGDYRLSFILMSVSGSILYIFSLFWYYRIAGKPTGNAY